MKPLNAFYRAALAACTWAAGAACVAMMALTCVDVSLRALGRPIVGAVELEAWLGTLTLAFALPATQQRRGQVGVEVLVRRLSGRARHLLEALTGLASLGLIGVAAWRLAVYGGQISAGHQVSLTIGLPTHLLIYCVAAAFCVLTLVLARQTRAALMAALGKEVAP